MAIAYSTERGRARPNGRSKPPGRGRARTGRVRDRALRGRLVSHARTVHTAMDVALTCADALLYQAADSDVSIASVLREACGSKLYGALLEVGVMVAELDGASDADPDSDEIAELVDPARS
jgi:hypothetical protein